MASNRKQVNRKNSGELWPALLAGVCLFVPLVFDPRGHLPFFPPKEAVLLFGVSLAAAAVVICRLRSNSASRIFSATRLRPDVTILLLMALFWIWSIAAPLMKMESAAVHLRGTIRLTALVALALGAAAAAAADPRWRERFATVAALPAIVMALHALFQAAGCDPLNIFGYELSDLKGRWRVFTTTGNPNWTAGYLAATSPLLAWVVHRAIWFRKPCLAWIAQASVWSILTAAVLTTGSRLGLAALLASAFLWWQHFRFSSLFRRIGTFIACSALAVLIGVVSGFITAERLTDKASVAGRLIYARAAWVLMADAPVTGRGLDQSGRLLPNGLGEVVPRLGPGWTPWIPKTLLARVPNGLLETTIESGIVGTALLLALWAMGLHRALSRSRAWKGDLVPLEAALAGVLAATAVLAIGDTPLHNPNLAVSFWMVVGLLAGGAIREQIKAPTVTAEANRSWSGRVLYLVLAAAVLIGAWTAVRQGLVTLIVNRQAYQAHAAFIYNRDADAERIFRNILSLDPTHHESSVVLSWYLLEQDHPLEALDLLDRTEHYAVSAEAWLVRGIALRDAGRPKAAVSVLENAVAAIPDLMRAHILLGDIYDELGDAQRAMEAYRLVLESPQNSPEALAWKVRVQKKLSWLDSWEELDFNW